MHDTTDCSHCSTYATLGVSIAPVPRLSTDALWLPREQLLLVRRTLDHQQVAACAEDVLIGPTSAR